MLWKKLTPFFHIKQKNRETLKSFAQRFNKEKFNIPRCNDAIAVKAFRKGLTQETPLYDSLTMKTPIAIIEVLKRTNQYIKLEEDKLEDKKERL